MGIASGTCGFYLTVVLIPMVGFLKIYESKQSLVASANYKCITVRWVNNWLITSPQFSGGRFSSCCYCRIKISPIASFETIYNGGAAFI